MLSFVLPLLSLLRDFHVFHCRSAPGERDSEGGIYDAISAFLSVHKFCRASMEMHRRYQFLESSFQISIYLGEVEVHATDEQRLLPEQHLRPGGAIPAKVQSLQVGVVFRHPDLIRHVLFKAIMWYPHEQICTKQGRHILQQNSIMQAPMF